MRGKFLVVFFFFFIVLFVMSIAMTVYHWLIGPFIILTIAAPLSIFLMIGGNNKRLQKKLEGVGVKAWATILSVQDTGMTMNNISIGIKMVVEVKSQVEAPFQSTVEAFVSRVNIPRAGDQIEVIYNPANHAEIAAITSL